MRIIEIFICKIYVNYTNNEFFWNKLKIYAFMLYFSIVGLLSFIFKTHDLTIFNNILFWISMEYLNNSYLYNDFDNSYSLIDLKNKNFLKNNLLEVEKKHIYSNTDEENYLNITNNSDIDNNPIEYFLDLLKKYLKMGKNK